jgi:hypothetical protein
MAKAKENPRTNAPANNMKVSTDKVPRYFTFELQTTTIKLYLMLIWLEPTCHHIVLVQ